MTGHHPEGRILAIAVRTSQRGPMQVVGHANTHVGGGLVGDLPVSRQRGITLLAAPQWQQVTRELGKDIPWHTRRANVLVDTPELAHLIGKIIDLGEVRLRIHAETKPCELMDELCPGLRAALTPECRAGVYGEVLEAGGIAVGDALTLVA